MDIQNYIKNIFQIKTDSEFNELAIELFNHQYDNNSTYQEYVNRIGHEIHTIKNYTQIPFLPIDFFRDKKILTQDSRHPSSEQIIFKSSGTTNNERSKHHVLDLEIYRKSIIENFKLFIGNPNEFVFLCLVPNIQHNPNSSLAFMCSELINNSNHIKSGFYLNKKAQLKSVILDLQKQSQKFILFGLSFEILDFAQKNQLSLNNGIIIETGGSKKHDKQIIKEDLHNRLKLYFSTKNIYSEYGMAELLSQSYYTNNNCFECPPWKKVLIRDKTNPLKILTDKKRGAINIIDLANVHSCAFIATNDFGYLTRIGFNIIGRNQNSTARGCNLMI